MRPGGWTSSGADRPASEPPGTRDHSALLDRLNASSDLLLTHTVPHGRAQLRMAIGAPSTTREHVTGAWQRIRREAAQLRGELS